MQRRPSKFIVFLAGMAIVVFLVGAHITSTSAAVVPCWPNPRPCLTVASEMALELGIEHVSVVATSDDLSSSSWRRAMVEFIREHSSIKSASSSPPFYVSSGSNFTLQLAGAVEDPVLFLAFGGGQSYSETEGGILQHLGDVDGDSVVLLEAAATSTVHELETLLEPAEIRYDTQLYLLQRPSNDSLLRVTEVYRVSSDHPLAAVPFAERSYDDDDRGLRFLTSDVEVWHRRADLMGTHLRVAARTNAPFITETADGCHSSGNSDPSEPKCLEGMYAEVLLELQRLTNFSFTLSVPPDMQWGTRQADDSWNGMIGMILAGQVDLAVSDFTVSEDRARVVDYLIPLTESHLRLIINNPSDSANWTAYLQPLTWQVWLVVAFLTATLPLVLAAVVLMVGAGDPSRRHFTLTKSCVFVAGAMFINRAHECTPDSARGRLVFLSVAVCGALVYWHWEAMIISYLAVRTIALPFASMEELLSEGDTKVILQSGTLYVDRFKYADDPLLNRMWKERMEPVQDLFQTSKDKMSEIVLDHGPGLAMINNFQAMQFREDYRTCKLIDIPRPYFPDQNTFIVAKGSPYRRALAFHLHLMDERGALGQIKERYRPPAQECPEYSGKPVGASQCLTAFIALAVGGGIGLACFCLEVASWRARKQGLFLGDDAHVGVLRRRLEYHAAKAQFHAGRCDQICEMLLDKEEQEEDVD